MSYVRSVALTGANQVVLGGAGVYRGFTIRETAGAAAVVRLYDNASAASGTPLEKITLGPNESAREFYQVGIWAENGIYANVASGAVAGSVRIG